MQTRGRCAVWSGRASVHSFVRGETSSAGILTQHFSPELTSPGARFLAGLQRGRFDLLQSGRSAPDEARSDGRKPRSSSVSNGPCQKDAAPALPRHIFLSVPQFTPGYTCLSARRLLLHYHANASTPEDQHCCCCQENCWIGTGDRKRPFSNQEALLSLNETLICPVNHHFQGQIGMKPSSSDGGMIRLRSRKSTFNNGF